MSRPHGRARTAAWWIAGLLATVIVTIVLYVRRTRLDHELRELPAPARRGLYLRTLETLRAACVEAHGPGLGGYCHDQATFITRFPECDDACRALAGRFAPSSTR